MRRLIRVECPDPIQLELASRQSLVDTGSAVGDEWESFRSIVMYRQLRAVLEEALGWRRRCAYCSDSNGADVEHFWPKKKFPERAFRFDNMCLICTPCNRKKSQRFPRDTAGAPLMIDPFFDDPWDSVFFAPATGWIAPRMVAVVNGIPQYAPKGVATLDVLGDLVNGEPARSARRRSWADIVARFAELVTGARTATSLLDGFGDIDDYGLAEWLWFREGKDSAEVVALRQANPSEWTKLRELPRN